MTVHRRPPIISYDVQPQGASVVYWIHRPSHTDMFSEGYIGITNRRANRRWVEHKRGGSCKTLSNALIKYDDVVFDIVLVANTRDYCEQIERKLRPHKNIGWNIKEGGDDAVPSNTYNTTPGGLANKKRIELLKQTHPDWIAKAKAKQQASIDKHEALIVRLKKRVIKMIKHEERKSLQLQINRKTHIKNKFGMTGVSWFTYPSGNGVWRSQFRGKLLGYFDDAQAAYRAYLNAKQCYLMNK